MSATFAYAAPAASSTRPQSDACRHSFNSVVYELRIRPCLSDALAVSRRILGSEDLAWDAVQEALIVLWDRPELPPDIGPWLVRTAYHRSLHLSRGERRRRRHERCLCDGRPELRPDLDPALLEEARERDHEVERALAELSPEQAEVFTLREREDLDYAAIAERVGVPVGTVRSRLSRARQSLSERLADSFAPELS
jgi:RNA polymerase sigma-70 factor (ECF subfamily)